MQICSNRYTMVRSSCRAVCVVVGAAVLLSGCATVGSVGCPVLKTYTQEQMNAVADDIGKRPVGDPTVAMVRDYKQLRAACRALGNARTPTS